MKTSNTLSALCIGVLMAYVPVGATLVSIASDNFTEYSNNTGLNGVAVEGTGLTGNWTVDGASAGVNAYTSTMSYSDFAAAGTVSGGYARPDNHWQNATLRESMATPQSIEVYTQYLFRMPSLPPTEDRAVGIRMNIGSSGLGFYVPGTTGDGNIFVGGGWGGTNSDAFTFAANTTYMLLGKLEHDGDNFTTASLWLNPVGSEYGNITGSAASITGVDISGMELSSLSQVSYSWNAMAHGSGSPHLGTFDVLAIPEPGTLVLVGVALGACLAFRRRRR